MAVLRKLFDVRPDEWPRFTILFAAFFIFSMGMAWASSSIRGVLINLENGPALYSSAFIYYGVATIVVSVIYTAVVDRMPKHFLLVIMTGISALAVTLNIVIVSMPQYQQVGAVALFVVYKVILLVWVLQWKTNLLDFYDTRTSKRILPLLGTARLLGLAVGSFSISLAVETFHVANPEDFFNYWAVNLFIVLALIWVLPRLMRDPKAKWPETRGGYLDSIGEGFAYISRSRYLLWMTISAVLMNAQIAVFDIFSTQLAESVFDSTAQVTAFFANAKGFSSVVLLLVQLFIFPRLLKRIGLGNMNLVYPLTAFGIGGAVVLALVTNLPRYLTLATAAATYITQDTFRRVFRTPVNGLLVNAVPSYMKGRARSVINGILSPFANIFIGAATLLDTIPGTEITSTQIFLVLVPLVSALYAYSAFVLRREYGREMLNLLKGEDYAALLSRDYELQAAPEMLIELQQRLNENDDPEFKQFLATVLLEVGGDDAVPYVVEAAQQSTPEAQSLLLRTLYESEATAPELRPFYNAHITSEDPDTRRLALKGLLGMTQPGQEIRYVIANDHIHDADPAVRGQMVVALLESEKPAHQDKAQRVLRAMQQDGHAEVRIAAVHALASLDDVQQIEELVWFLDDADDEVREAATFAIADLWRDDMPAKIPQLILNREKMLLDDAVERVRQAELAILGRIGDDIAIRSLVRALVDRSPEIRKAAQESLSNLGKKAVPHLLTASQDEDRALRAQAVIVLHGIEGKRYNDDLLHLALEALDEIYTHYGRIAALDQCQEYPSFGVLRAHYTEENQALLEEVFQVLGARHGTDKISTIVETLHSDNARTRINAVEALESMTTPELAQLVGGLYDAASTPQSLAEACKERSGKEFPSLETLLKTLATGADPWLRAVSVMALGELGADYDAVQKLFTMTDSTIPTTSPNLDDCQKQISAQFIAVTVRGALASHNPDMQRTARAAVRMILGQPIFDAATEEDSTMLSIIERMIFLKRVSFFQSLAVEQLKAVATICEEKTYKAGEVLFREGDEGGTLFVVVSGQVEVGLMNEESDNFTMLATYGTSTAFGEMSLFDGSPRSADAVATQETLVVTLQRAPFLSLTRQYPDLSVHVITALSDRLRNANVHIARLNNTMAEIMDV